MSARLAGFAVLLVLTFMTIVILLGLAHQLPGQDPAPTPPAPTPTHTDYQLPTL